MVGVVILFVLTAVLIIGGIVLLCMPFEAWMGGMTIALSFFSALFAVLKLDDEKGIFSKAIDKKQRENAEKIYSGKTQTTPLKMVPMFIKAYDERKEYGRAYIEGKAIHNIVSAYKHILRRWTYVLYVSDYFKDNENIKDKNDIKHYIGTALENVFASYIAYGDSFDACYSAYCSVCKKINCVPRSQEKIKGFLGDTEKSEELRKKAAKEIVFFNNISRKYMKAEKYEELVQGFCYLSLLNEVVYEDEYSFIELVFFNKEFGDIYPKTWEQFKKEYE